MIEIVCKNLSKAVTDAEVKAILAAIQIQLTRDVCPAWNLQPMHLLFAAKDAALLKGQWQVIFLDHTTEAGALGYHDVTANGDPIGYIGVQDTLDDGGLPSVTASHEIVEMAGNSRLDDSEFDGPGNRFYIRELCDAVELDSLGYKISGVQVSDFVLPGWFQPDVAHTAKLSFCGHVSKPYQLASGGYISFVDLAHPSKGWQQIFADKAQKRAGTSRGAMRERVATLHGARRRSTAS